MKVTPAISNKAFKGPDGKRYVMVSAVTIIPVEDSALTIGHQFSNGKVTVFQKAISNETTLSTIRNEKAYLVPTIHEGDTIAQCLDALNIAALKQLQLFLPTQ